MLFADDMVTSQNAAGPGLCLELTESVLNCSSIRRNWQGRLCFLSELVDLYAVESFDGNFFATSGYDLTGRNL